MISLIGYASRVENIQHILLDFRRNRVIDKAKLSPLDEFAKASYADQVRVLNSTRLAVDQQRALFGAIMNMHTAIKTMKARLEIASEIHENPTTAELSLELIENLSNVAIGLDGFFIRDRMPQIRSFNETSRALYKKAKQLGFSEDDSSQFAALGIEPKDVSNFTENLNKNIRAHTDIDEDAGSDVGSTNENNN